MAATKVIGMISVLRDNHCDDYAKHQLDGAISHLQALEQVGYVAINRAFKMVDIAYNHVCKDCDEGETFDLFNEVLGELDDMVMG